MSLDVGKHIRGSHLTQTIVLMSIIINLYTSGMCVCVCVCVCVRTHILNFSPCLCDTKSDLNNIIVLIPTKYTWTAQHGVDIFKENQYLLYFVFFYTLTI